jgi:hypothetical protein
MEHWYTLTQDDDESGGEYQLESGRVGGIGLYMLIVLTEDHDDMHICLSDNESGCFFEVDREYHKSLYPQTSE